MSDDNDGGHSNTFGPPRGPDGKIDWSLLPLKTLGPKLLLKAASLDRFFQTRGAPTPLQSHRSGSSLKTLEQLEFILLTNAGTS